jgi:hypothetical protein
MGRYKTGARGAQRKTSAEKKYGRNRRSGTPPIRPLQYPLMPQYLSVREAELWQRRYAK